MIVEIVLGSELLTNISQFSNVYNSKEREYKGNEDHVYDFVRPMVPKMGLTDYLLDFRTYNTLEIFW